MAGEGKKELSDLTADTTLVATDIIHFKESGGDDKRLTIANLLAFLNSNMQAYVKVSDTKPNSTASGTFTAGAWQTRVITTEDSDTDNICSIASNQITLDAGRYRCLIVCPAYDVTRHKARLQNITGAATLLLGSSMYALAAQNHYNQSIIQGKFTLAVSSVLEIQHWCTVTQANDGLGVASGIGVSEIFTVAEFWKEA